MEIVPPIIDKPTPAAAAAAPTAITAGPATAAPAMANSTQPTKAPVPAVAAPATANVSPVIKAALTICYKTSTFSLTFLTSFSFSSYSSLTFFFIFSLS